MVEETKQEVPKENLSLIEQTIQTVERLEKAKTEAKIEADRLERLKSDAMLSGTAGIRPNMQSTEQTKKDIAKEFWKGTNIEKAIEKYG